MSTKEENAVITCNLGLKEEHIEIQKRHLLILNDKILVQA
jgi:hypothetical protein